MEHMAITFASACSYAFYVARDHLERVRHEACARMIDENIEPPCDPELGITAEGLMYRYGEEEEAGTWAEWQVKWAKWDKNGLERMKEDEGQYRNDVKERKFAGLLENGLEEEKEQYRVYDPDEIFASAPSCIPV